MLSILTVLFFVFVSCVVLYFQHEKQLEVEALMLEGASIEHVPELNTLIANHEVRERIAANILEVVFNENVLTQQSRHNEEIQHAEVFVVDDGGGVHVIGRATSGRNRNAIVELERRAEVLAELLGLELVRA